MRNSKKINLHYWVLLLFTTTIHLYAQTGIGTTTPAVKLHVKSNGGIFRMEGSDHAYMELYPKGPSTRYAYLGYPGTNSTTLTLMNQFSAGLLAFGTNNSSKMWLNEDGKLGLGTATPGTSLHIENANTFGTDPSNTTSPSLYILNTNNTSSSAHASALIRTAGLTGGKPYLGFDIVGQFGYSMGINNSSDQFIINTDWNFNTSTASSNALIINNAGQSRVIIPYSGGSYQNDWPSGWGGGLATYDISASAIYYNSLVQRSDRRLKNAIADINNDVKTNYLKLRPVTYYWNQDKPRDTSLQYGLIAQEVETLFPERVLTATDLGQTKSINYQALHALSLKVIQTQQTEIEELKQKQLDLEDRLKLLESKIK